MTRKTLARLTREAGFAFDEESGSWSSYFARFRLGSEPAAPVSATN